jgi:hypothetical protein
MSMKRDDFFRKRERVIKDVDIGLGGTVRVRSMTAGERARLEASRLDKEGNLIPNRVRTFRERLAVATVVDEEGELMFTEGDIERLSELPAESLDKLADAAMELAGMKESSRRLEDLAGNSVTLTVSDGPSDTSASQQDGLTGSVTSMK